MISFLAAPENIVFVSALLLMVLIGLVQLIGFGFDADLDGDADLNGSPLDFLSWIGVGRLPVLMLLVVFLAIFGAIGLIGQQLSHDLFDELAAIELAIPAAIVLALPLTGLAARGLARILPRDHSTAIELDWLKGASAQIVTGRASAGSPARARVEDMHGQVHYVMVEPNSPQQVFEEGETVLLVHREDQLFRAISRGDFHLPRLEV